MSIRVSVLYLLVVGLALYAWKDWFKSLCGLIVLMAIIEHGDMPRAMFGIPGMNAWNFLFGMILLAWLANRRREGLTWDLPPRLNLLLLLYLGVLLVGAARAAFDPSHLEGHGVKGVIFEEVLNTVKWVLPALLLFDGCRTRNQVLLALSCLLLMYFLMAIQVVRSMPLEAVTSESQLINYSRMKLGRRVGYNACDLSAMLAGACWGLIAVLPLIRRKRYWPPIFMAAGVVALGQALTGGRAGYLAWGATGLAMCLLKWRRQLILAPVVVMLLPVIFPGAANRMLEGFGQTDPTGETTVDEYAVSGGRLEVWPRVIDTIWESPLIGHGRLAMRRTGLTLSTGAGHPHNLYLETLLDNGIAGSLPIFLFWGTIFLYSVRLLRRRNPLYSAVGGLAFALTLAQLLAGIGAQHYFPLESTLGVWAAAFLALRVYVEEMRTQTFAVRESAPSVTAARVEHVAAV